MQCPNCQSRLREIDYEGIHIETCDDCGGEWLDDRELRLTTGIREVRFTTEEKQAIVQSHSISGVKLKDVDRDLPCPKCQGTTDAINYGGDTGIIIDRCTECKGLWLDAVELEKIQQLVEGWEDGLSGDLAKHSPKLREVAIEQDRSNDWSYSRIGFLNAIVNGIIDIWD